MLRLWGQTLRAENLEIDCCWFPTTYQGVCLANIHREWCFIFISGCLQVCLMSLMDISWKIKPFIWSTAPSLYLSSCWNGNFGLEWKSFAFTPTQRRKNKTYWSNLFPHKTFLEFPSMISIWFLFYSYDTVVTLWHCISLHVLMLTLILTNEPLNLWILHRALLAF